MRQLGHTIPVATCPNTMVVPVTTGGGCATTTAAGCDCTTVVAEKTNNGHLYFMYTSEHAENCVFNLFHLCENRCGDANVAFTHEITCDFICDASLKLLVFWYECFVASKAPCLIAAPFCQQPSYMDIFKFHCC